MDFSYRNHLKSGFLRSRDEYVPGGIHYCKINCCERIPNTPIAEAMHAAKLIQISAGNLPIVLCLSGGVDSECMAIAFSEAQVPFKAVIMRFKNNLNYFDICDAISFCERLNVDYDFFDLDVIGFFNDKCHLDYANQYRCVSPQLATHLELLKNIKGFPVLTWNPVAINVFPNEVYNILLPGDLYFTYHRFFLSQNRAGVAFFFLYTPELIYSFWRLPIMQKWLFDPLPEGSRMSNYLLKCQTYRDGGFKINERKDKFTGFEKVKEYFSNFFNESEDSFNKRFRTPLVEKYPLPQRHYRIVSNKFFNAKEDTNQKVN